MAHHHHPSHGIIDGWERGGQVDNDVKEKETGDRGNGEHLMSLYLYIYPCSLNTRLTMQSAL